jgi:hypothetical protein
MIRLLVMEIENARKADKSILFQIVFDGILLLNPRVKENLTTEMQKNHHIVKICI